MKTITLTVLTILMANSVNSSANAQSLEVGEIAYGGTGCPDGSILLIANPLDPSTATLALDAFKVEAGGTTGKTVDRKACSLAIPLKVPAGYSVALLPPKVEGFLALSRKGTARFAMEVFYAGSHGPKTTKTYSGRTLRQILIEPTPSDDQLDWSPCGEDVILRANLSLMVTASSRRALGTLERLGQNDGLFQIAWKECLN